MRRSVQENPERYPDWTEERLRSFKGVCASVSHEQMKRLADEGAFARKASSRSNEKQKQNTGDVPDQKLLAPPPSDVREDSIQHERTIASNAITRDMCSDLTKELAKLSHAQEALIRSHDIATQAITKVAEIVQQLTSHLATQEPLVTSHDPDQASRGLGTITARPPAERKLSSEVPFSSPSPSKNRHRNSHESSSSRNVRRKASRGASDGTGRASSMEPQRGRPLQ